MARLASILWPASVAAAFAAGLLLRPAPAPPPVAAAPSMVAPPLVVAARAARGLTTSDVRTVLREELAGLRAPAEAAEGEAQPAPAPDEAPLIRAHETLAAAMADGRWSEEDAIQMRRALATLSPEQAREVYTVLFPALNSGQLRIDVDGPPL